MECIAVKIGRKEYYVDKSYVEGFMEVPRLYRVPGAPALIEGITLYQESPVMFYRLSAADGDPLERKRCGILLSGEGGWFYGIIGEVIEQSAKQSDELSPVYPGVWEMQGDSVK